MHAPGLRLTSILEWGVAAAFLVATVGVASLILQNLVRESSVRAVAAPVQVEISAVPASVPAGAVSVPVLPFRDGKEIRVGDTAGMVAERLGPGAESGREEADHGRLGHRLTRFYEYAGFRFIVVYEPFEKNGSPRISAIYLP